MTVSEKVAEMKSDAKNVANAIKAKGVTVPNEVKLSQLSSLVNSIPQTGGSSSSSSDTCVVRITPYGSNMPYLFKVIYKTPSGYVSTEDTRNFTMIVSSTRMIPMLRPRPVRK